MTGQQRTPVYEALTSYLQQENISFHFPGHKQGKGITPALLRAMGKFLWRLDVTELPGLGQLHPSTGPVREAEELAAQCFGAGETYFLVNGATSGAQALILAWCKPGEKVVLPRNAHSSVLGGLILGGALPVYVEPEINPGWGDFALGLSPDKVKKALNEHPDARMLLLLHPTYQGAVGNLRDILALVRERDIKVVTDEAHGAHFCFHPLLPPAALELGTDATVHGSHKTLPTLTQTAMLHLRHADFCVAQALQTISTTSPSFVFLASLDVARSQMAVFGHRLWQETMDRLMEFKIKLGQIKGIRVAESEIRETESVVGWDPAKLVISGSELGLGGFEMSHILRTKYRIQTEMAGMGYILFAFGTGNRKSDYEALYKALADISANHRVEFAKKGPKMRLTSPLTLPGIPPVVLSPREAFFASRRPVALAAARGKVAAEMVVPYPPGIPILCPGEEISDEIVEYLEAMRPLPITWRGPADCALQTIQIIDCL
ncbi:MAG: aminotransferase class I/II-fold pyridoxal phosphate-dependent enzyme [Bacillota bacterium]